MDSCNITQVGTIHIVTSFNEGDVICSKQWWDNGMLLFFKATEYDVMQYSGKAREYVMIVKTV